MIKTDYKLIKKLGAGAYSEVFLAQHKITGIHRCIKVISKQEFDYSDNEDIMNEINVLKKIDHPNIMRIMEYYMTSKHIYIISEYLTGGELFDRIIESQKFTEQLAAKYIKQILSAVSYLH